MSTNISPSAILTLRPAVPEDAAAIARMAQLDSALVPDGALIVAVVDGVPLAALSTLTGEVVADPFSRTAGLVAMLRDRAAGLQAASEPATRTRRWRRAISLRAA